MCGRYNNHRKAMQRWAEILKDWPSDEARLSYNVAPTTQVPIVTAQGVRQARWGMIPAWAEEFKNKYPTINARIETAATLPTFRGAWKAGRTCLIPAAGYYEWPEHLDKQPYYFKMPDDDLIVFAGLWEPWQDRISCTILTEEPHGAIAELHDRMPVMLTPDYARRWLAEGTRMNPSGAGVCFEIEFFPVGKAVNKVRNDGPELIERVCL